MRNSYALLEDRLTGEYRAAFSQVEKYQFAHVIDSEEMDDRMMELLDQLLLAQENSQPVSKIIGKDMETFCSNFFSDYTSGARLDSMFRKFHTVFLIIFAITAIECFSEISESNFSFRTSTDVSFITVALACALVADAVTFIIIRPLIRRFPKVKNGVWMSIPSVLIVALALLCYCGPEKLRLGFQILLPSWAILLVSGIYLAFYYGIKAVNNKKLYGTIKAPKQNEISFWSVVNENSNKDLRTDWYKQYKKKNEKLKAKGKSLVTEEKYLNELAKNYNLRNRRKKTYAIFAGLTAIVLLQYWLTISYDQESIIIGITYTIILCVVEGITAKFTAKADKSACQAFDTMIEELKESGLTYEEFMRKEKN